MTEGRGAARGYPWSSAVVYAAELEPDGTVADANDALRALAGRDLAGEPFAGLLTEAQRPAFAGLLAEADGDWRSRTFGFAHGPTGTAEDRCLWLRRGADGRVTVFAEPASVERHRELEQAHERAENAVRRVRRLESIVLAGLAPRDLDAALDALLAVAGEVLPGDGAAVLLLDDTRQWLVIRATVGESALAAIPEGRVRFGEGIAGRVAAGGRSMYVEDLARSPFAVSRVPGSLLAVPLRVEGQIVGVLGASAPEPASFTENDLRLLELVGERAALAIGHAQLRERERNLVATLQRSLLPEGLPEPDGIAIAARYEPQAATVHVGGDFYDAIELADGSVGVAIGDVVGKGLPAAATMGRLRSALRAYALEAGSPADLLARLDRLAVTDGAMATAMYLLVAPDRHSASLASAGHPPPLWIAGGDAGYVGLERALSPPLGLRMATEAQREIELAPGTTLVLYTDGIVERTRDIDEGMEALRRAALAAPRELAALCDDLVTGLAPAAGYLDDVALLALRV